MAACNTNLALRRGRLRTIGEQQRSAAIAAGTPLSHWR
jgi:hypothetical protein